MTKTDGKYNRVRISAYVITSLLRTRLARNTTKYMHFDLIRFSTHKVYSWIDEETFYAIDNIAWLWPSI